jgi:dimethylargininase
VAHGRGADREQLPDSGAEQTVPTFGYDVHRITAPGTLDGGDVLKVGDIMYVARGGRTNGEGIRQLRAVFSLLCIHVIAVPLTKVLHLKTAVTALPDGTIIGWRFRGFDVLGKSRNDQHPTSEQEAHPARLTA